LHYSAYSELEGKKSEKLKSEKEKGKEKKFALIN